MRIVSSKIVGVIIGLIGLSACGGGGGGGGDSEGGSEYGVRVLHGAIDAAPVDVISSARSGLVVSQAVFAGSKGYGSLPSGAQSLTLTRTLSPSQVVASFDATVESQDRYSLLLYGDSQTFGLRTRLIKDDVPSDVSGASIRVVNGATGASSVIVAFSGGAGTEVEFGQNSQYLSISSGTITVRSTRRSDGAVVTSANVSLEEGAAYTYLIAGQVGYYTKGVLFRDR